MTELFRIECDELPHEAKVVSIEGTEAISRPYGFTVHVATPGEEECAFDPGSIVGKAAKLVFLDDDGAERSHVHGVLASAELVHEIPSHALYEFVLVPRFWLASLGRHSRVFVDESIPDIVEKLLKKAKLKSPDDYELRLVKKYAKRDHVCQYGESNLDFISRWMEHEGMYYFFEQGDKREKLIITDDKSKQEKLDSQPLRYFPLVGDQPTAHEALYTFRCRTVSLPQKVKLTDYDYLRPETELKAEAPAADLGTDELSLHGENFVSDDVGKRLAKVRAEELLARQVVFNGSGHAFEVRSGYKFKLEDHPRSSLNQEYMVLEIHHRGVQTGGGFDGLGASERAGYRVELKAIAADTQFRPERKTPAPRIYGLEVGIVDGPADDDHAQLDDHGRYFVKIKFDESDLKDGKASTRVRMAQPHAGNPEGFHFPLRKHTEVLLSFLGGDPDRPVIVGAVPNATNPSMVTKDNATQNVLHTGGDTRIEIEDDKDKQYIDITTPPKKSALHLGAENKTFKHNLVLTTDGKGLIHTGDDHEITVDGNQKETIKKNLTEEFQGDQTTHVTGARKETIDKGETRTVSQGVKETITGGVTRTIDGGTKDTIAGGETRTITGDVTETIAGALKQTITGGLQVTTPQDVKITAAAGITMIAPAGTKIIAPGGHTLIAPGGQTTVDSFFQKLGGALNEVFQLKSTVVAMKHDVVALATAVNGIKIEANLVKMERTTVRSQNTPLDLKQANNVVSSAAIGLYMKAILIVS